VSGHVTFMAYWLCDENCTFFQSVRPKCAERARATSSYVMRSSSSRVIGGATTGAEGVDAAAVAVASGVGTATGGTGASSSLPVGARDLNVMVIYEVRRDEAKRLCSRCR
jgi:hypothetical protein